MKKTTDFISQHGIKIILIFLAILMFKTCNVHRDVEKTKKSQIEMNAKIDSLLNENINNSEMIELIKETPAWKTLRIEEISDKERISINALEENDN